jgi:uncharacterized membrane protein YfcA
VESVFMPRNEPVTMRYAVISVLSGFLTGVLAGLVGLGGAEERIPFILYALKEPLYDMVVANLIISFATSGLNFALRARAGLLSLDALVISIAMIAGSIPGAYLGAWFSHRVSERKLKGFIAFVLSLVVARLVSDFFLRTPNVPLNLPFYYEMILSIFFGFVIGNISGSIGVAGGEYRIPVLLFIFGFPIKIAGTASQLVSLPTIAVGLLRHRNLGFITKRSLTLALLMGGPSVVGVFVSLKLLLTSGEDLIRLVFALLLSYTIIQLILELRNRPAKT